LHIRPFKNITPKIHDSVYVDPAAVIIGDVSIGADSSIWPCTVIRGDVNNIVIGARTNIQDGCVLHVTHKNEKNKNGYALILGDEVTVGHGVILHGCTIQSLCLIGMGVIIMDGAIVNSQTYVGAGSLVPPNAILDSGYLWLGSPVKKIRPLTAEEIAFLPYTAGQYVNLKNEYIK